MADTVHLFTGWPIVVAACISSAVPVRAEHPLGRGTRTHPDDRRCHPYRRLHAHRGQQDSRAGASEERRLSAYSCAGRRAANARSCRVQFVGAMVNLAARNHEVIRMAGMLDLGQSCIEGGPEHGSRVVGAQFEPGTQTRLVIIRCVVGGFDAEMPPPGKLTTSIG